MDMQSFLDDLLKTGREYAEKGQKMAEEKLNINAEGDKRDATLDGMKKGALAAGALALLLGTGAGRKLTGSALKIGSLAAVGGIAYKTWQNWQEEQAKKVADEAEAAQKVEVNLTKALTVDKLEGDEAEERSQILIKAMMAAAKSDGKIDDAETEALNKQIKKLGLGSSIEDVFKAGMVTPLSAKSVAKMADNKEIAAEIYIVSMMVTDNDNNQERSYMSSLADALELPIDVVHELENYRK
ncbi:MAG: tellurite resistance TerB family protein [Thiotrichaceae bacterium]